VLRVNPQPDLHPRQLHARHGLRRLRPVNPRLKYANRHRARRDVLLLRLARVPYPVDRARASGRVLNRGPVEVAPVRYRDPGQALQPYGADRVSLQQDHRCAVVTLPRFGSALLPVVIAHQDRPGFFVPRRRVAHQGRPGFCVRRRRVVPQDRTGFRVRRRRVAHQGRPGFCVRRRRVVPQDRTGFCAPRRRVALFAPSLSRVHRGLALSCGPPALSLDSRPGETAQTGPPPPL